MVILRMINQSTGCWVKKKYRQQFLGHTKSHSGFKTGHHIHSVQATNNNSQSGESIKCFDAVPMKIYFNLSFPNVLGNATNVDQHKYVWLDRGLNFIINKFWLYHKSGNLLEDFQNYNLLYGIEKVWIGSSAVSRYCTSFFYETRGADTSAQAAADVFPREKVLSM